jgi:hypothetical protein
VASFQGLKALKAYLHDLKQGSLDQSEGLERTKRRYLWLWIAIFVMLTASMVLGLLKALQL